MKKSLCLCLFLTSFVGLSAAAQADVANFQAKCTWNASNTAFTCNFDGQRPTSGPSICSNGTAPEYRWDFYNDGSYDTGWSYSSTTSHTYNSPPLGTYGYHAKLEIRCFETITTYTGDTETRYICVFGIGGGGCIPVNGTWS